MWQQQQQQLAIANHSTRLFWANIWRQWRWQRLKTANQVHRYRYPSNPPPPRNSPPFWPMAYDPWPLTPIRTPLAVGLPSSTYHRKFLAVDSSGKNNNNTTNRCRGHRTFAHIHTHYHTRPPHDLQKDECSACTETNNQSGRYILQLTKEELRGNAMNLNWILKSIWS